MVLIHVIRNGYFFVSPLIVIAFSHLFSCGVGKYDMPKVYCNPAELPDYIALYSQPCEYHKTANTCVSFYDYDIKFDNDNGLYNAIQTN